jgi:hypothetical protein
LKNSKYNSNYTGSNNSQLSLKENSICDRKGKCIKKSVTNITLDELLKYLPSTKLEIVLKLIRDKNLNPDEIKE